MNLKGRNFLKLLDYTPEEIGYLLDLAAELKAKKKAGVAHDMLRGQKHCPRSLKRPPPAPAAAFEVAAARSGYAGNLSGSLWLSDRQKGVHCRYRSGAGPYV